MLHVFGRCTLGRISQNGGNVDFPKVARMSGSHCSALNGYRTILGYSHCKNSDVVAGSTRKTVEPWFCYMFCSCKCACGKWHFDNCTDRSNRTSKNLLSIRLLLNSWLFRLKMLESKGVATDFYGQFWTGANCAGWNPAKHQWKGGQ